MNFAGPGEAIDNRSFSSSYHQLSNKQYDLASDKSHQEISFGDFSKEDCEKYFTVKDVTQYGVEFICDLFSPVGDWIETCSKQKFMEVSNKYSSEINTENDVKTDSNQSFTETNDTDNNTLIIKNKNESSDNNNKELKIEEKRTSNETNDNNKISVEKRSTNSSDIQPSSWASLFKKDSSAENNDSQKNTSNGVHVANVFSVQIEEVQVKNTNVVVNTKEETISLIAIEDDKRALQIAEHISTLTSNFSRHHLQVRGLVNRSNWCYINTVLQALHGISPISHFYKSLKKFLNKSKSTSIPVTDSIIKFFNEFEAINPKISLKKQTEDLRGGAPFEPRYVYDVLPVMKTTLSEKGRQEDAEEFLSFLLNGIHDELVALVKLQSLKQPVLTNGTSSEHEDNENDGEHDDTDAWEHVGRKNKSSTVRKAVIAESFIKDIFGGVIRSSVHQSGVKESTTLQPFFTLQLDIQSEKIFSLKDAIEFCFMKETLQGFTCSKTNTEVEASRRMSLEGLPTIFIFHLKYFVFNRQGGSQKLHKHIEIPVDLEIPKDVLSPTLKNKSANGRSYRLYAVVYHHGKNAAGGHYTAAVHHGNPFGWVLFDDNIIKTINVNQVLKHQQGCVPYLLFYEKHLQSK